MNKFQKKYNDSINLVSHLILTKPTPVIGLLAKHGTTFKGTPERNQIIDEVIELLKVNKKFEGDLGKLLTVHIQYRGKEMLALERSEFNSYNDVEDQDEDEFWGALAKGAVGIIGGLVGKKKKRRRSSGRNTTTQAAQAKQDVQMQMARMRQAQEARRREEAERRRREETERRRREEEAKRERERSRRKQTNTMLIAGGGIAVLAVIGVVLAKSNSPKQPVMYSQSAPASNR